MDDPDLAQDIRHAFAWADQLIGQMAEEKPWDLELGTDPVADIIAIDNLRDRLAAVGIIVPEFPDANVDPVGNLDAWRDFLAPLVEGRRPDPEQREPAPTRKPEDDWLDDLWRLSFPWIATAFYLALFVIVPLGSLGFMAFGFLKTGQWVVIDIRSFTSWSPQTDWIGFNQVAEWALGLWVGWPAIATGALSVWAYINRDSV